MIFADSAGNQETIAGEMKAPKPIRRMSEKQKAKLIGSGSFQFNSTIRRTSCNAITAGSQFRESKNTPTCTDSDSAPRLKFQSSRNAAKTYLSASFGKQRKPVKKQGERQKLRLRKLEQVRKGWWKESESSGKPLICGICDEQIWHFEDLASDHIEPGSAKSDSETNLQPSHRRCNICKGSIRNFKIVRGDHNWLLIHGML
jgi:5-methylcytosine-specific restriction endonuclease McrA